MKLSKSRLKSMPNSDCDDRDAGRANSRLARATFTSCAGVTMTTLNDATRTNLHLPDQMSRAHLEVKLESNCQDLFNARGRCD